MCELALRGVIKRSFCKHPELFLAGQAPSQPGILADEGLFPRISQPGKHAGWDAVALSLEPHTLESYQCETGESKISRPTIGTPTALSNLAGVGSH